MVGPALAGFNSERTGRLIKLWYDKPAVHFEVQRLTGTWGPGPQPCLEVGLHLESKDREANDRVMRGLVRVRQSWGPALKSAEAGEAFGPMATSWRRVSEVVHPPDLDEDSAGEVAELLAAYIKALQPLI